MLLAKVYSNKHASFWAFLCAFVCHRQVVCGCMCAGAAGINFQIFSFFFFFCKCNKSWLKRKNHSLAWVCPQKHKIFAHFMETFVFFYLLGIHRNTRCIIVMISKEVCYLYEEPISARLVVPEIRSSTSEREWKWLVRYCMLKLPAP